VKKRQRDYAAMGRARAKKLTPERRREIARMGGAALWKKLRHQAYLLDKAQKSA